MICKNCNKELFFHDRVYRNLESYDVGGTKLIVSECCGIGYQVKMNVSYTTAIYEGSRTEDDWGVSIKAKS